MDLDSFKYVWQTQEAEPPASPEEMRALLQRKSQGPVAKMQRNLTRELLIVIMTYVPAIVFLLVTGKGQFGGIALLLLALGLFFGGYYYRKQKLLKSMLCVTCEVRSNLARQVAILKKYVRFYLIAGTAVLPLTALFTWLILEQAIQQKATYHRAHLLGEWDNPLLWLAVLIPLTIGFYYLNVWYIHKLYGKHIKKLQRLLLEMNKE